MTSARWRSVDLRKRKAYAHAVMNCEQELNLGQAGAAPEGWLRSRDHGKCASMIVSKRDALSYVRLGIGRHMSTQLAGMIFGIVFGLLVMILFLKK